ncbi:imelysin family protein [Roseomonas terrae]|uniref:Imelysin family protein n=1 Tax=Neoroseomonas terrae TaxID=424799 RepID=A0ABS5EE32_9PROT|nr:imelysin family protein [Neoroseomonas terrae]MBR0649276.1 imelysin family protein [Neoroseomonas terrae]
MPTRRLVLAALILTPVAAARGQEVEAVQRAAIRRAVAQHIIPGYTAFAEAARAFATASEAARADPAQAEAARRAWVATDLAFQRIRHLRFGPLDDFDRGFRISFFPDTRNSIGREMGELLRAADPAQVTPDAFRRGRVAAQGLPASERLLFGDEAPRLAAADQPFRRVLLAAIGTNLATMGDDMLQAWTRSERPYGTLLEGTPDGGYASTLDGVVTLFKNVVGGLEFLAEREVARVLGPSLREAFPRRAEAWRSGESLALVRASLAAQQQFWTVTFAPMTEAADPALAREVADLYAEAVAAAGRIAPSLEVAVTTPDGRAAVEDLLRPLGTLRRLLAERVAPAIGLPLGFNSMDGD